MMIRSLWILGILSGCAATAPAPAPSASRKAPVPPVAKVSDTCLAAVQRQVERAGFALVLTANDVLAAGNVELLDTLYRKLHGVAGVQSVRAIADEQVVRASDLDVSVEPFVTTTGLASVSERRERYHRFQHLLDPSLLSADLGATMLIVKLLPTSQENARGEIREAIQKRLARMPADVEAFLIEYPLAAAESMAWPTDRARKGLDIVRRHLGGGGILDVGISCPDADCLLEPVHLASIFRFQKIVDGMPRVRTSRSLASVIGAAWKAVGGHDDMPPTRDQALQLIAMMSGGGGFRLHADERFRRGTVRIYFEAGSASDYCRLGKALKKAARESTTGTLRFRVRRPERDGY